VEPSLAQAVGFVVACSDGKAVTGSISDKDLRDGALAYKTIRAGTTTIRIAAGRDRSINDTEMARHILTLCAEDKPVGWINKATGMIRHHEKIKPGKKILRSPSGVRSSSDSRG
jgi:hypothetical protein